MAPVAVLLYLRPDHAKRTLQTLACNYLAKETEVYVFINVPSTNCIREEDVALNKAVIEVAKEFEQSFGKYHIVIRNAYLECNESICGAVTEMLNIYDKVIVLEDDIETERNFLDYMNSALDYYENDMTVWNISAYCPMAINGANGNVFRSCSFMPWGWGVWKNRWDMVDWARKYEKLCQIDFAFVRDNMPLFDLALRQDILTGNRYMYWDYIYSLTQARLKAATIFPKKSLVRNFGNDGTGETEIDGVADNGTDLMTESALQREFVFDEYQLTDSEKAKFTELLYYRHERSPMDKEAYNKRFWFYIWLRLKLAGASLENYLSEKGIGEVAVYGMGYAGELLCQELNGSVKVSYVMDRSGRSVIGNIPLLSAESQLPAVDLIIVTVSRSFNDIEQQLRTKTDCKIISFEDLLFEWALCEKELRSK